MKPPPLPPHAFRPGPGQAAPSVQPGPEPVAARVVQVQVPMLAPASVTPLVASLALRRLYDEALRHYPFGSRAFAQAAYGPLDMGHPMEAALNRVENKARDVISLATLDEMAQVTAHLQAGNLLEAARYLLDTVYPRLLHEGVIRGSRLKPVNAVAYHAPYVDPRIEKTSYVWQEGGPRKRRFSDRYRKIGSYKPVTGPDKVTHLSLPTLTVSLNRNRVVLSNELCRQLGAMMQRDGLGDLHHGSKIELEPPRLGRSSGPRVWYLDVRPTAPGRLTHTPNTRPQFDSLRTLPRALFHAVAAVPSGPLSTGSIKLRLLPDVPEVPGYYPLEVVSR